MKTFNINGEEHHFRLAASMEDEFSKQAEIIGFVPFVKKCLEKGAKKAKSKITYTEEDVDDLLTDSRDEVSEAQEEESLKEGEETKIKISEHLYLYAKKEYSRIEQQILVKKSTDKMSEEVLQSAKQRALRQKG